jgi:hypothetical protein
MFSFILLNNLQAGGLIVATKLKGVIGVIGRCDLLLPTPSEIIIHYGNTAPFREVVALLRRRFLCDILIAIAKGDILPAAGPILNLPILLA